MHGSLKFSTHPFRYFDRLVSLSLISVLTLAVLMFSPPATTERKASATANAAESFITLTSLSNSVTANVHALTQNGLFATSTAEQSASFALTTNNYTGYTLSIMSDDDDGNLSTAVEPGDVSETISSISDITTAEDFSATTTAAESYNSKWGIRPSKYVDATNNTTVDNTGDNPVYLPSPTTIPTFLDKTTSANTTANVYTLAIGVRANQDTKSGIYTKVLGLAAIANPVSYTIEYDQNTDDIVANMPATQANDSMSSTSLALSDMIPLRSHYSFIGWCDVQPTTTNGVDSCAGTTYNPNGDGTDLTYGIDQTTANEATLYAMWKIDTFTCNRQYRLQNVDGTWGEYQEDISKTVNYGDSCSYSKTMANYRAENGSNNSTVSASVSNITSDVTLRLDLYRNTYTCVKRYRLQNVDGTWGEYQEESSETVIHGGSCSYSKDVTGFHAYGEDNDSTVSASASDVASDVTLSLDLYRNTYTCAKRYRLQNADGSWGEYQEESSETVNYGGTCSYSKTVADYRAGDGANDSTASTGIANVVSNTTLSLDLYRNTYTCTKRYRLQNVDGTWGEYQEESSETVIHGGSCSYSKDVTGYHAYNEDNDSAVSASASDVTSDVTLSLDLYRNTYTCVKRYRLQNADGTWGEYQEESSETVNYGGSCSYSKTVADYRAGDGVNDSTASTSIANVISDTILNLDLYRNVYSLTVSAGSNTNSPTGSGTYRWGENVAIGVTKTSNTTCNSYGTPTWSQSSIAGSLSSTAGVSTTFTMGKSDATVTAASVSSDIAQSIALSRSGGASSININGTDYTEDSVSLNCGTYDISGNYDSGYEFDSWSGSDVSVANTSASSTTMTVSGAGALTLAGKRSCISLPSGTGIMQTYSISVSTLADVCVGSTTTLTDNRDNEVYTIGKLADGNIWLLDNLALDLTNSAVLNTLSTSNTNASAASLTSLRSGNRAAGDQYANGALGNLTSGNSYSVALINADYKNQTKPFAVGQSGSGRVGVYYNYCAASAGSYCYGDGATHSTPYDDTTEDICPKGWRMPTGGYSGEYNALYAAYSNDKAAFANALRVPLSGRFYSGSIGLQGSQGVYWTSSYYRGINSNDGRYMDGPEFTSSSLYLPPNANNRYIGISVRCVLQASDISQISTMQDFADSNAAAIKNSMTTGQAYTLIDSRDGETYNVAKLADGKVWLLDNLRLDLANTTVKNNLTPSTTNASYATLNYLKNGGGTTSDKYATSGVANWVGGYSFSDPLANSAYKNTTGTGGYEAGKYGIYYNYCAASAGSYCYGNGSSSSGSPSGNATEDICPRGWRMPTSGTSGEYQALYAAYSSDHTSFVNALRTPLSGFFATDGSAGNQGLYGSFWSSIYYGGDYYMYSLNVGSSTINLQGAQMRPSGSPVRCILNT